MYRGRHLLARRLTLIAWCLVDLRTVLTALDLKSVGEARTKASVAALEYGSTRDDAGDDLAGCILLACRFAEHDNLAITRICGFYKDFMHQARLMSMCSDLHAGTQVRNQHDPVKSQ